MIPLHRVVTEKRAVVVPLAVAAVVNLLGYALVVYPLGGRVSAASQRALAAERSVVQAERQFAAAQATTEGRDRAARELGRFYGEVLPPDQTGARRITYLRLAEMARSAGLRYERRSVSQEQERGSTLTRMQMTMVLSGQYADIRQFIHALEVSPEFVVIDNVQLVQGRAASEPLTLTLTLGTYYREPGAADGP